MKGKVRAILFCAVMFSFLLISGCKKRCYSYCKIIDVYGYCNKGSDSVQFSVVGLYTYLDTVTYYRNKGYQCDSSNVSGHVSGTFCDKITDPYWDCEY